VKLIVPYVDEMQAVDVRLVRLAEFLGIDCEPIPLPKSTGQYAEYLEKVVQPSCLVVNPRVIEKWIGGNPLPPDLISCLVSRFPYLLCHAPRLNDPFDASVFAALSHGQIRVVEKIDHSAASYEIATDTKDICEAFAGLTFGPAKHNDCVFSIVGAAIRKLISIGGRPLMCMASDEKNKIVFLAGQDVVDLKTEVGEAPLTEYFSQLLPHAMALRHIFGEECWRPCKHHASVIVDDPLLRRNYGFLNFETLLSLMGQHNFHTTIAFIPHNFRRNSPRITRMFQENPNRLALCFHGNDHTGAEFASTNTTLLNTLLHIGEQRMSVHRKITGLDCGQVMVFPQGNFSIEAMAALKAHNFEAAVNTVPHPRQQSVDLTIGELAQPAVLRYANFPLFLRKDSQSTQGPDIAFNLFFGRPILIVEHHDIFQHPQSLIEAATRINSIAPEIHWTSLSNAVENSILKRRAPDGTYHVRAYSATVRVSNESNTVTRFAVEWSHSGQNSSVETVLIDGKTSLSFDADDAGIQLHVDLAPKASHVFSVVHRNTQPSMASLGFRWNAKAFVRRRLSEFRDNYLSKNPQVLAAAKAVQRRLSGALPKSSAVGSDPKAIGQTQKFVSNTIPHTFPREQKRT
jgi:hypothetical protein